MLSVVCFGDSLTDVNAFGYSWTETFQELRTDLEVVNSGKYGGMTTDFLLSDKKTVNWTAMHNAVMRYAPDVVLITLGGNDIVQTTDQPDEIFNRYKSIVKYMRDSGIHVVMGAYDMTKGQCDAIYDDGWHNHSKVMTKMWFSTYSRLIRNYANTWRIKEPVISLYEAITENKSIPEQYLRDAVHLSPLGAEKVGQYVAETLGGYFDRMEE